MRLRPAATAAVFVGGLMLHGTAFSDSDITYVASMAYQHKTLSFDQSYTGQSLTQENFADFSADLPMMSFGLSMASSGFFLSLKYESNIADTSTSTSETDRSPVFESNLLTHAGGSIDVSREDINLTLGYNVWKTLNVFVGFLHGETELSPDPFCSNYTYSFNVNDLPPNAFFNEETGDVAVNCVRLNRAAQQHFLLLAAQQGAFGSAENNEIYSRTPSYQQTYVEEGVFAGASYAVNVKDWGTLSFAGAYALMDGSYDDNVYDPSGIWGSSFEAFDYEGDSKGLSLAATWTSALGDNSAYYIDVRRQAYSMKGDDSTGRLQDVKLRTDEVMFGLTAGVQFYF